MIEKNSITREESIAFPVVYGRPVGVDLRGTVGTAWIKGRRLSLRDLLNLAEHLGRTSLIKFGPDSGFAYRFKNADRAEASNVACIFWNIKADTYMRLRCQMVDLVRLNPIQQLDQVGGVGDVSVV